jgi:methyl-accepting chemotaxis protein
MIDTTLENAEHGLLEKRVQPNEDFRWQEQIARITAVCRQAARGDLEARVTGCGEAGPISELSRAINDMLDRADSFVREASAAAHDFSRDRFHRPILLQGLKGAYRNSGCVINQAGLKMQERHSQLQETAKLASETAENVGTVAAACEELHTTNREISRQVSSCAGQTKQAVQQASEAGGALNEMSSATRNIEKMTALINRIAAQTNLLALNATIEASRAGESGRGFAVVAGEVKELARSSGAAVENIGLQIESLQAIVQRVAKMMHGVEDTIRTIDKNTADIDRIGQEQAKATDEISHRISDVALTTNRISSGMKSVRGKNDAGVSEPWDGK